MSINHVDVTQITGYLIKGALTSWQTKNGQFNVEHLAGITPDNELIVFWWSPQHDWQAVNVSQKTKHAIVTPVTSWITKNGPYTVEHLAGIDPENNLIVFWWSPQHDWQAVNVTSLTGTKLISPVTSWQTDNGPYNVEHLAGVNADGEVFVFWWSPQHDWKSLNVSAITGQKIRTQLTSWQTKNGQFNVEHLAGVSYSNDLIAFWWSPQHDWQAVNVSTKSGKKLSSAVTSWQTTSGRYNVEHLAGTDSFGNLIVYWWSPKHDWQAVIVNSGQCRQSFSYPTNYQIKDNTGNAEILNIRGSADEMLHYWWKPSTDWQVIDMSLITNKKIMGPPESWLTPSGNNDVMVEHIAAESNNNHLLVFWFNKAVRDIFDSEGEYTACWQNIGPKNFTCVIKSICVDPINENTVYTGAEFGGVWKTSNGGQAWRPTMDKLPNLNVNALGLCRTSPNVLYAAMRGSTNNICRTNDAANSWVMVTSFAGDSPNAIGVHPSDPNIVYVASNSSLHKSTNGGLSWQVNNVERDGSIKTNSFGIFDGLIDDVKINPVTPETIYIAVRNSGFYKSTDGGYTWFKKGGNFSFESKDGGDVQQVILNGSGRTRIAIGEDTRRGSQGSEFIALKVQATVLVSLDGGDTWRQISAPDLQYNGQLWWNSCIAVSPDDQNFIAIGGNGISYTKNANASNPTWHNLNSFHSDQQFIDFSLSDARNFYFANDGFVARCLNNGAVAENISEGLVASQGFFVAVSQTPILVAGTSTYHTGVLRTGRKDFSTWEYMAGNEGGLIEICPHNEKKMFCNPWAPGDLRRSFDGGSTWDSKKLKAVNDQGDLVDAYCTILEIRPDNGQKIYAGSFYGQLHFSHNGGDSWEVVKMQNGGLFLPDGGNARNNRITSIGYAESNGDFAYLSTTSGTLWRTINGAITSAGWDQLNTPSGATGTIIGLAVSHLSPNLVLVGYDDKDRDDNLWYGTRLVNGNYSWTNISGVYAQNHLPQAMIYAIVIDPDHANRIFVATSKGVYYSESAGVSWRPYNQGMPSVIEVRGLEFRKRTRVLYATAFGRGIYRRWIGN